MANGTVAFDTLQTSGQITGTAKSLDTDYVVNGSAKARINFDGTSSGTTIRDSFNISSSTDNAAGVYTITLSNAMSSTNTIVSSGMCTDDGATNNHVANISLDRTLGGSPFTTTTVAYNTCFEDNTATQNDMDFVTTLVDGDLA